ncbi:MAG: type II secretion system protein [Pseudomonadota bacterium]
MRIHIKNWRMRGVLGQKQAGFSYLVAIFMVAVVAMLTLQAQSNMATNERRRKEDELLLVGQAYRNAIRDYYVNAPGSNRTFPPTIDALLLDTRTSRISRHLRKAYVDPITGSATWGVIAAPDGGIMGVYSLSVQAPIKVDGFPDELFSFVGAKKYQDWKFVYQPI